MLEFGPVSKEDDSTHYHCVVYNDKEKVLSNKAFLTVKKIIKPSIETHPHDTTLNVGDPVLFEIKTSGAKLTFQWLKNGVQVDQATDHTYLIESVTLQDNNSKFSCIVSNPGGNVISNEATLTVKKNYNSTRNF